MPRTKTPPHLVSAEVVAQRLGITRPSVYKAAARGEIPSIRILERWLFDPDSIEQWIADQLAASVKPRRSSAA